MNKITLRPFIPADAPWVAERHGTLYARDEGFDQTFQPLVQSVLDDFIAHHDPSCEHGWIAERDGTRLGCIFCVRLTDTTAKLRLFLVDPAARGQQLGLRLLETCMRFARTHGYAGMQLWTHESHQAATALYARTGWTRVESKPVHSFGVDLVEQSWEIAFD